LSLFDAHMVEILSERVQRVVVIRFAESRGQKSDEHDSFAMAERVQGRPKDSSVVPGGSGVRRERP
jgi:hypothetical protein